VNPLLRIFGVRPDPPDPAAHWECPTCGHRHPVGVFRLGRVVPSEVVLREQYEDGRINVETFERLLDLDRRDHLVGMERLT
jgi:hypothetical protein